MNHGDAVCLVETPDRSRGEDAGSVCGQGAGHQLVPALDGFPGMERPSHPGSPHRGPSAFTDPPPNQGPMAWPIRVLFVNRRIRIRTYGGVGAGGGGPPLATRFSPLAVSCR